MKKLILAVALTLLFAFTLPATSLAKSDTVAPAGFYNFNTENFIPLISFTFMTQQQKVAILMDQYYLVLGDESFSTKDILTADTDAELDKRKLTVDQLKDKYGVEIDSDGKITSGAEDGDFAVLSIE